jgi:hypothetical protein
MEHWVGGVWRAGRCTGGAGKGWPVTLYSVDRRIWVLSESDGELGFHPLLAGLAQWPSSVAGVKSMVAA